MAEPHIPQKTPFKFEVEEGKTYAWCRCGLSESQPTCDGKHSTTEFRPEVFKAEKTESVWLCGCKQTQKPPFCDGSHSKL